MRASGTLCSPGSSRTLWSKHLRAHTCSRSPKEPEAEPAVPFLPATTTWALVCGIPVAARLAYISELALAVLGCWEQISRSQGDESELARAAEAGSSRREFGGGRVSMARRVGVDPSRCWSLLFPSSHCCTAAGENIFVNLVSNYCVPLVR